ncbi:MAG: excinuclease ABC subunit UvrC [Eubacteriaceae bacterium]|jgi:excinuclease ABC subunit C|nr:excinuclease ABC subunit UvrC [Eubacteriaceae bacterium]
MNEKIARKLENLPRKPGVYMMLNENGDIIYVGKAKTLVNRVRTYFHSPEGHTAKVAHMVGNIDDLNYIICDSEAEALLLECNLIKEHRPYYNILLKDGKSFPFVAVTASEEYPRLIVTRRRTQGRDRYFGPFHNTSAAREAVDGANRVFPLQKCTKKTSFGQSVGKVCLYFHIGQCMGCCTGAVDPSEYKKYSERAASAFSGKSQAIIEDLRRAMGEEAEKLNFEAAGVHKSAIAAFETLFSADQKVAKPSGEDLDIVAAAFDEKEAAIQMFHFRDGKMNKADMAKMAMKGGGESRNDIVRSFLLQYYENSLSIPPTVLLEEPLAEQSVVEEALSARRGASVHIKVPQKGEKMRLLQLASANAAMSIEAARTRSENRENRQKSALSELGRALGAPIRRIEAYDISNIASSFNVGAMVAFNNGKKEPNFYRKFRIKEVDGQNDYASMSEMIFRRLSRAKEEMEAGDQNPKFLPLPDLIVTDGGLAHLQAAKRVVDLFGYSITVCGLVKNHSHRLRALVKEDGEEIPLEKLKASSHLLNEISEEVHRSAISYHKSLRSNAMVATELSEIEGIGEKRAIALMRRFGSIERIARASREELADADSMSARTADAVFQHFHSAN